MPSDNRIRANEVQSAEIEHPLAAEVVRILQGLGRRAYHTSPFDILSAALEELRVRAILAQRQASGLWPKALEWLAQAQCGPEFIESTRTLNGHYGNYRCARTLQRRKFVLLPSENQCFRPKVAAKS